MRTHNRIFKMEHSHNETITEPAQFNMDSADDCEPKVEGRWPQSHVTKKGIATWDSICIWTDKTASVTRATGQSTAMKSP